LAMAAASAAIEPDAYRDRHGIAVAVVSGSGSGSESDGAGHPRSGGAPGSAAAAAARRWAPVQTFAVAPFHAKLLQELRHANFGAPTPVQAQCWPIACGGHDVVAIAKTGSGKTLGYLLPVFHRFLAGAAPPAAPGGSPFAVVLAPTRELVLQIHEQAARFGHTAGVTSTCVYGGAGAPRHSQLPALLAGPRVVIGTPGRLVDFMTEAASPTQPKPALSVQHTQVLVLDEADRMLGMGFSNDIRAVVRRLPPHRQTLLFSATWPKSVRELAAQLQRRPSSADAAEQQEVLTVQITLGGAEHRLTANRAVTQHVHKVEAGGEAQLAKLYEVLDALLAADGSKVICFVNRKSTCGDVVQQLQLRNVLWAAEALHGDRTQAERIATLAHFDSGGCRVLVATDVAARGLDVSGITAVVNFDFPAAGKSDRKKGPETYIHRIGRCGRAGATGEAHTLFDPARDGRYGRALCKILKAAEQNRPLWLRRLAKDGAGAQPSGLSKAQREKAKLSRMMASHKSLELGVASVSDEMLLLEENGGLDDAGDDGQRRADARKRKRKPDGAGGRGGAAAGGRGRGAGSGAVQHNNHARHRTAAPPRVR